MKTPKQKIGRIGENTAVKFLIGKGYKILGRNYLKKWGEIDVIAEKDKAIHFVEVKTVSCETAGYKPEDNVHPWKMRRLARACQTYLMDNNVSHETYWQIDVLAVFLDLGRKKAKLRLTENVIM